MCALQCILVSQIVIRGQEDDLGSAGGRADAEAGVGTEL